MVSKFLKHLKTKENKNPKHYHISVLGSYGKQLETIKRRVRAKLDPYLIGFNNILCTLCAHQQNECKTPSTVGTGRSWQGIAFICKTRRWGQVPNSIQSVCAIILGVGSSLACQLLRSFLLLAIGVLLLHRQYCTAMLGMQTICS